MRPLTAGPRRNWRAVGTSRRMPQKRADAVGSFRRKNVLELASLLLDLGLIFYVQSFDEQPFGQSVTADHVLCALAAALGKFQRDVPVACAGCTIGMHQFMAAV